MTPKQEKQFNQMLFALKKIAKYQTPKQLRKGSVKQYGIKYEEALEMSYENIQSDAVFYSKGIRFIDSNPTKP